ncbi:MAG: hypothetical protein ACE5GO_07930 [Anaerolineales bacterium]
MLTQIENDLRLRVEDIQYLPQHRCPWCDAPGVPTPQGTWYSPWMVLGPGACALDAWGDHLAYVRFACGRDCHPRGSLRAARLGDALLPLAFASPQEARVLGVLPDRLNADRVRQAVNFLAAHANPERTAGEDALAHTVYALAAGAVSPETALRKIRTWASPPAPAFSKNGGPAHVRRR